jgi:hypothetical protein
VTTRELVAVYLRRDPAARYDWALAVGTALIMSVPFIAGAAVGHFADGLLVALAAWLTAVAVPRPGRAERLGQYALRSVLLTGATAIGMATGGQLWAVLAASSFFALAAPIRSVAATPLICLIVALPTGSTSGSSAANPAIHLAMFFLGCTWTSLVMLVPAFGGRYQAPPETGHVPADGQPGPSAEPWYRRLRHIPSGFRAIRVTPTVRYAVRLCVCFDIAYAGLTLLHVPRVSWALVGILTMLRANWSDTYSRIVKRLGGIAFGCVITVVLFLVTSRAPVGVTVLAIVLLGAIARPMRGYNYGYWPVFATPVLLLLTQLSAPLDLADIALRLANNMLGALFVVAGTLLIWPSRRQRCLASLLTDLLDTHADLLVRSVGEPAGGSPERDMSDLLANAESVAEELNRLRADLADHPGRHQLLEDLGVVAEEAATLRQQAVRPAAPGDAGDAGGAGDRQRAVTLLHDGVGSSATAEREREATGSLDTTPLLKTAARLSAVAGQLIGAGQAGGACVDVRRVWERRVRRPVDRDQGGSWSRRRRPPC